MTVGKTIVRRTEISSHACCASTVAFALDSYGGGTLPLFSHDGVYETLATNHIHSADAIRSSSLRIRDHVVL